MRPGMLWKDVREAERGKKGNRRGGAEEGRGRTVREEK